MLNILVNFTLLLSLLACLQTTTIQVDEFNINNQNLIDYINEGKLKMRSTTLSTQKRAIMVLGVTGVGKSTLVNYLSDIPLRCTRINGVWRLDLAQPNTTSTQTCDFKRIGHLNSETIYPSTCTPSKTNISDDHLVTYIDTPGFQDNRGFEIEIGNSFFREEVLRQVEYLKFLLMINHADVIDRRVQFYDTIKRLSDFLGKKEVFFLFRDTIVNLKYQQSSESNE